MSYITLNRKYRPRTFQTVIGQDYTIKTLLNSVKFNKVGHAYIFAGPKGIGKTTIARIFAKAINCLQPINGDVCNECANCLSINENQTTDIVELDAASNNGVEDIRNVIDAANFLPTHLNKKVYIIDEAHMLTPGAWNALLKTLEESPEHVVFIFATTETQRIPPTITSRCQHFQFNRLTNKHLLKMLIDIASKENIKIEQDAIDKIVELADGSGRDALSILEQLATYTNNDINLNAINTVFGLINDEYKINLINLILQKNTVEIIKLINQYEERGIDFLHLANDLITILIDKLIYLQTNNSQILKKLNKNNVAAININKDDLVILLNTWQEFYLKIKNANDAKFYFEMATFASFKINSKSQQNITIEPEIIKPNKVEPIIAKLDPLPPLNDVFTYAEHKIKPQGSIEIEKPKFTKKIESIPNISINDLFLQIAYNFTNPAWQKAKEFLEHVKTMPSPGHLVDIIPATKVLVASKNGIVLEFNDDMDADLLNSQTYKFDFLKEVKQYFSYPIYIIAVDKDKTNDFVMNFKQEKKRGRAFDEPNTKNLSEILKSNNAAEQLAIEMFEN